MEFNWGGRRVLIPRPIPVVWGFYIYPLLALSVSAALDRVWLLVGGFLTLALVFYVIFIEQKAIVLKDSALRYGFYRKVGRHQIERVIVEFNSSNATGLPLLYGSVMLNDGREVALDSLSAFIFRAPPWDDVRTVQQAKEIAAWAEAPLEVIEKSRR